MGKTGRREKMRRVAEGSVTDCARAARDGTTPSHLGGAVMGETGRRGNAAGPVAEGSRAGELP